MEMRTKNVDEKFCKDCGAVIKAKAEICPSCGVRQTGFSLGVGKNKWIAALLALFLGAIGVHKFYLGKPIQGILYIVFCWTFLPALISFIEAIIYLCTSEEDFAKRYPS